MTWSLQQSATSLQDLNGNMWVNRIVIINSGKLNGQVAEVKGTGNGWVQLSLLKTNNIYLSNQQTIQAAANVVNTKKRVYDLAIPTCDKSVIKNKKRGIKVKGASVFSSTIDDSSVIGRQIKIVLQGDNNALPPFHPCCLNQKATIVCGRKSAGLYICNITVNNITYEYFILEKQIEWLEQEDTIDITIDPDLPSKSMVDTTNTLLQHKVTRKRKRGGARNFKKNGDSNNNANGTNGVGM